MIPGGRRNSRRRGTQNRAARERTTAWAPILGPYYPGPYYPGPYYPGPLVGSPDPVCAGLKQVHLIIGCAVAWDEFIHPWDDGRMIPGGRRDQVGY